MAWLFSAIVCFCHFPLTNFTVVSCCQDHSSRGTLLTFYSLNSVNSGNQKKKLCIFQKLTLPHGLTVRLPVDVVDVKSWQFFTFDEFIHELTLTHTSYFFENPDQLKNGQSGLCYQVTVLSAVSPPQKKMGLTVHHHWFIPGMNSALPVIEQSFKQTSDRTYESRSTLFPSWILLYFAQ